MNLSSENWFQGFAFKCNVYRYGAVDKAYVDKTFNGVTWFKYREDTVKKTSMDSTEVGRLDSTAVDVLRNH